MDSFILGDDIKVIYVKATRSPEGVSEAHIKLRSLVPHPDDRKYFGISSPDKNGVIVYMAAAEELFTDEAVNLGLPSFTIKHGAYMSFYIKDYRENIGAIADAFKLLIGQQEADPNGYWLEWYIGENDVKCLVPSGPENYPE